MLSSATPVTREELRSYDQLGEVPLRNSSALWLSVSLRGVRESEFFSITANKMENENLTDE